MTDDGKFNYMENVLNNICGNFVSLDAAEMDRNNKILKEIIEIITRNLKATDGLFKALFERVFYGGSFYDGLKVGQPDEYDLDLLLRLPKTMKPSIILCNEPGFVKMVFGDVAAIDREPTLKNKYKGIEQLYDSQTHELDTEKMLSWIQSIMAHALRCFSENGQHYIISTSRGKFKMIPSKKGNSPAFTLKIENTFDNYLSRGIKMDIDLVPCVVFGTEQWPEGFRINSTDKYEFFIVPKHPPGYTSYWRLSFQEQERVLIMSKQNLKPALRLLKKLRDTQKHDSIKSYFLKTIVLLEIHNRPDDFWRKPLSYVFMTLLQKYLDRLYQQNIPYYWNGIFNLVGRVHYDNLINQRNRINSIIQDIERNPNNTDVIKKYLLTYDERMKMNVTQSSSSNPIISNVQCPDSSTDENNQEDNQASTTTTSNVLGVGLAAVGVVSAVTLGAIALERFFNRPRRND